MQTPASFAGHPIHPMLVPIAIGGFVLSFAFDVIGIVTGGIEPWATVAYYTMLGGIAGAGFAAVFGLIDLTKVPRGKTAKVGIAHMVLNVLVIVLFSASAGLRHNGQAGALPFGLSAVGLLLLVAAGWLGGKLVFEAAIGVSEPPIRD
jgi:uncharacterized membrane protein